MKELSVILLHNNQIFCEHFNKWILAVAMLLSMQDTLDIQEPCWKP